MMKHSRVYRNQATVIPKEIQEKTQFQISDIIRWTINKNNKEISVKFFEFDQVDTKLLDNTVQTEDYIHIYRNISKKRHIVLPAEIERLLKFNYRENLLKWSMDEEKITIDKIDKANILNISGILIKQGGLEENE